MQSAELTLPQTVVQTNGTSHKGAHSTDNPVPVRLTAMRRRLPDERQSFTHRFSVGGHKGYLTVGMYPTGEPGELFILMAKEGSTVSGLMSSFAQVVSVALQYGIPLDVFCEKFTHTRFEPSGFTGNAEIPIATSIMDYVFRFLRLRFSGAQTSPGPVQDIVSSHLSVSTSGRPATSSDAPPCVHCGSLTKPSGACFICANCGESSGCS